MGSRIEVGATVTLAFGAGIANQARGCECTPTNQIPLKFDENAIVLYVILQRWIDLNDYRPSDE
jgi:hypothetical protein